MTQIPNVAVERVTTGTVVYVENLKSKSEQQNLALRRIEFGQPTSQIGALDKIVVKLNPIAFGSGIPLFEALNQHVSLKLKNTKTYKCGIVLLRISRH